MFDSAIRLRLGRLLVACFLTLFVATITLYIGQGFRGIANKMLPDLTNEFPGMLVNRHNRLAGHKSNGWQVLPWQNRSGPMTTKVEARRRKTTTGTNYLVEATLSLSTSNSVQCDVRCEAIFKLDSSYLVYAFDRTKAEAYWHDGNNVVSRTTLSKAAYRSDFSEGRWKVEFSPPAHQSLGNLVVYCTEYGSESWASLDLPGPHSRFAEACWSLP